MSKTIKQKIKIQSPSKHIIKIFLKFKNQNRHNLRKTILLVVGVHICTFWWAWCHNQRCTQNWVKKTKEQKNVFKIK